VGWYIDVNIGQWNKDYIVTAWQLNQVGLQ
jgi:hypothetical protein